MSCFQSLFYLSSVAWVGFFSLANNCFCRSRRCCFSVSMRVARCCLSWYRCLDSSASKLLQAGSGDSSMWIQFTGQGAIHSSQPVHCWLITVCSSFDAPRMASTGQGGRHLVQPMQSASLITATCLGRCSPKLGSRGLYSTFKSAARLLMPCSPPGGHWFMSAWLLLIAWA